LKCAAVRSLVEVARSLLGRRAFKKKERSPVQEPTITTTTTNDFKEKTTASAGGLNSVNHNRAALERRASGGEGPAIGPS